MSSDLGRNPSSLMTKGTRLIVNRRLEKSPAEATKAPTAMNVPSQGPATASAMTVKAPAVHSMSSVPAAANPAIVGSR